ncbi:hypothetical protein BDZ91DRAFT_735964 [Kalaharituber pfeilii]|nr:hypothetical protein BDZ91DRAFT_735964 [Kalaharituber pfeilii]
MTCSTHHLIREPEAAPTFYLLHIGYAAADSFRTGRRDGLLTASAARLYAPVCLRPLSFGLVDWCCNSLPQFLEPAIQAQAGLDTAHTHPLHKISIKPCCLHTCWAASTSYTEEVNTFPLPAYAVYVHVHVWPPVMLKRRTPLHGLAFLSERDIFFVLKRGEQELRNFWFNIGIGSVFYFVEGAASPVVPEGTIVTLAVGCSIPKATGQKG